MTDTCATCRHRGNIVTKGRREYTPMWRVFFGAKPYRFPEQPRRVRGKLACLHPDCEDAYNPFWVLDLDRCSEWEAGNDHNA
jgi:hypothetical protein